MSPARDVRPIASHGGGRGHHGGGGGSYYDDEGRGTSKDLWVWFQEYFGSNPTLKHLLELDDYTCHRCLALSVVRHGLADVAYKFVPGWREYQDTRAHRLVRTKLTESDWVKFHAHLLAGYERHVAKVEQERHERAVAYQGEHDAYMARVEAERIEVQRRDNEYISNIVSITAGTLDTELAQVFDSSDRVGSEGEWIEDVVETYQDGSGFGYEMQKATGVVLQVTLALDLSNSMYYNGVHKEAANAFRDIGLSLKALKAEHPDDLFISFYTFSGNNWEGKGKEVNRLELPASRANGEDLAQEFKAYAPSAIAKWYRDEAFDGTDTWFAPLFTKIEKWENENSEPGAVRLDLVLTDAVLEHKKDILECDIIQERRDGSLQTVFLNFLDPKDAINSTLPKRCFQTFVSKDNVAGVLRQVLSDFVTAHM